MTLKPIHLAAFGIAALSPLLVPQNGPIEPLELKAMVENMGYTVKMLNEEKGKEKFSFDLKTSDFNIPVAGEITSSRNYVWFTVYLGDPPKSADRHTELLKQNFAIQPDFFYITEKGKLMLGVPVDNRGITAAVVKRVTEKLAEDVGKTSKAWKEE